MLRDAVALQASKAPPLRQPAKPIAQGVVHELGFALSGRRTVTAITSSIASAIQPRGHALPQLLPDGLHPQQNLAAARLLEHLMKQGPLLPAWCCAALASQGHNATDLDVARMAVAAALERLFEVTLVESVRLVSAVRLHIRPVVARQNVAFMREVQFVTGTSDPCFLADYLIGMPMLG